MDDTPIVTPKAAEIFADPLPAEILNQLKAKKRQELQTRLGQAAQEQALWLFSEKFHLVQPEFAAWVEDQFADRSSTLREAVRVYRVWLDNRRRMGRAEEKDEP